MTAKNNAFFVNSDRLWSDLEQLGQIGRDPRGRGVSRLAFTPEDVAGRRWLLARMREAGLKAWMDGVGNVFGRYEPTDVGEREVTDCGSAKVACRETKGRERESAVNVDHSGTTPDSSVRDNPDAKYPAIMLGSHIDTVPEGGRFDGTVGVLGALECVRTLIESGAILKHSIEVAAFANEEGSRIGHGTLGSRSFVQGLLREGSSQDEVAGLAQVLEQAAISGDPRRLKDGELACYLEPHIEQGGVLDASGEDIGVVTGIVGIRSFTAKFLGMANHAGTTPMNMRKDALLAAARFILDVPEFVSELGSGSSVGTCGRISVLPGGQNVIPGEAEVSAEVRDVDNDVSERIILALREHAAAIAQERDVQVSVSPASAILAVPLDEQIQGDIEAAADELNLRSRRMPSGAAHDCMHLAGLVPSGMVFVPSRKGISHSPDEWTEREQCAAGANVLLKTVLRLDARLDVRLD